MRLEKRAASIFLTMLYHFLIVRPFYICFALLCLMVRTVVATILEGSHGNSSVYCIVANVVWLEAERGYIAESRVLRAGWLELALARRFTVKHCMLGRFLESSERLSNGTLRVYTTDDLPNFCREPKQPATTTSTTRRLKAMSEYLSSYLAVRLSLTVPPYRYYRMLQASCPLRYLLAWYRLNPARMPECAAPSVVLRSGK
jgi:lysylphosphatidylglycerol synthetase-like protein (DUF2156 family)